MARLPIALAAGIVAGSLFAGAAGAASRCAASKLAAVARDAACQLKLEAGEAHGGTPPGSEKLQRCRDALADAFARAESRPPCLTSADSAALGGRVDAFLADADAALSVALPNACQSSKLRGVRKATRCLLRLEAKQARKDVPPDPARLEACRDGLAARFAKAERKPGCSTSADAAALQALLDAFVEEVSAALAPSGASVPFERVVIDSGLSGYLDCKAVGDLDGDGLPDVIVGTDTQLVWYEAPGWTQHAIGPGANFTTDMQVGDVDADGDLDVVVPEYDLQRIEWYRNPHIGGGAWTPVPIDTGVTAHDVEVADLNGDGKLDVAIRGHFGPTTLYLQETPASWMPVPIAAAIDSEGLHLADVDADGRTDVVQNGYWLEAPDDPSDGNAWTRHGFDAGWEAGTVAVTAADLSGDGRLDVILAFGESEGRIAWYEAPADPRVGAAWIEHPVADPVDHVHTFKTGDVDGDGELDIVFAEMAQSEQKRVGFFRNRGGGLAWSLQVLSTDGSHNLRVADVGADGDLDIVGANWQGPPVELWENLTVP